VVAALRVVIVFWRIDVEVSHRVNTNLFCLSLMLTSPDLGTVLSMVEPSSVLSNSESLGRLTGTFLLFLLPLQAAGVVPRTQAVLSGQLSPSPRPALAATVVHLPQPVGGVPTQDDTVPVGTSGQPVPVGAVVVSAQTQAVVGLVQRVPEGQIAVVTAEVSSAAAVLTSLHLQATTGSFITTCQLHAVVTLEGALHVPTIVGPVEVQVPVQSLGGLRTQASSLPGCAAVVVTNASKAAHPAPVGATASEVQVQVGVGFLHVTPVQAAPVAAVATASVTGSAAGSAAALAVLHSQVVG